MSDLLNSAIQDVRNSKSAFCRFITANDVGQTGSHQSGFYIPKDSWQLLFDTPGVKGENKDCRIRIQWNNDIVTDSRAIYYGTGTRNEYRITRFGRGFPFLNVQYSGCLLVIAKMDEAEFKGYILDSDMDIDDFLAFFDISPADQNHLINLQNIRPEKELKNIINSLLQQNTSFPTTHQMSSMARMARELAFKHDDLWASFNPDEALVGWIDTEYQLFRAFEEREFEQKGRGNFPDRQSLIDFSNSLLNRRKSRAGKSLEHHLAHIFNIENIKFEEQVITEGNKKPDFIFPDGAAYHNLLFPTDGLTFLGAKTTCKDRWRQVLNEANRIPSKYLFTLQPGISPNQLDEMREENLTLVIPKSNLKTFVPTHHNQLMTLEAFITVVKNKQDRFCAHN